MGLSWTAERHGGAEEEVGLDEPVAIAGLLGPMHHVSTGYHPPHLSEAADGHVEQVPITWTPASANGGTVVVCH